MFLQSNVSPSFSIAISLFNLIILDDFSHNRTDQRDICDSEPKTYKNDDFFKIICYFLNGVLIRFSCFLYRKMTNDNNTPIDTTNVTTILLNVAATDATMTTAGNITASTTEATTSTILPAGNAADETTRRSLFGAGLYQTGSVSGTASDPVAVQTPPAVPSVFTQGLMPNQFDGKGFKMWQKNMMFFLTTMKLDKFIQEDKPLMPYGIDDDHSLATVDIWVQLFNLIILDDFSHNRTDLRERCDSEPKTYKNDDFLKKIRSML